MNKIFILITTLFITSCGPTVIMLHNPETREVTKCTGDPLGMPVKEARICAEGYEKMGWERIEQKK